MAQPDYRHTTTNIDVHFDPLGIRAWLSCVLDIMMPEAIDLKFIAAPLTSNQLKEGRKRSAGRFQVCREGAYRWLRGRFSAEVGSRSSVIGRVNHPRRDLARSIGVCPASPPTP